MREIKFRVYCEYEFEGKLEKGMESPASWFLLTQGGELWTYEPMAPPQPLSKEYIKTIPLFYTGLKDFDEEDICEGDILEFHNVQYTKEIMSVQWTNNNTYCGWNISSTFVQSGNARIIGNIYENPELIK